MLVSLFARRYLFSRKSHSVINVISAVSAFALSVPVAAMVILLSVFNGFEGLVKSMYNEFDPDIMVTATQGKVFDASTDIDARLAGVADVVAYSCMIEENVMAEYRGGQYIATVRGVDSMYATVVPIEDMITLGEYKLMFGDIEQAVVGQGVAYNLGINTAMFDYIHLYAPKRGGFSSILPIDSYRVENLLPVGEFALDAETDSKYIIAPIDFARRLFDYPGKATNIAVKLREGADPQKAREKISAALGDGFKVLTRYEQKASLYKIMRYEKWSIFIIISLVLVIASFSIVGSLVMLVIEKQEDMRTIINMGGSVSFVRKVFLREGAYIAGTGALFGMIIGVGFCLLQQRFGLISISAETFLVDKYPVILKGGDLVVVTLSFVAVSWVIIKLTVSKMIPKSTIRL